MIDFNEIVADVVSERILLPDFQRTFVWRDIERQTRLIASVLARLPIGSVLLLEGSTLEFSSKRIGRKTPIVFTEDETRKYLLDGQQRITVLVNAFSDHILSSGALGDLVSPSLKVRFFLNLKKYEDFSKMDIFGLTNLIFPFEPNRDPDFLAEQVYELISSRSTVNDAVFSVGVNLARYDNKVKMTGECIGEISKVPLFLLGSSLGKDIAESIIEEIAKTREHELNSLSAQYFNNSNVEPYKKFLETINPQNVDLIDQLSANEESASNQIKSLKNKWAREFIKYLDSSISQMYLNKIDVNRAQRARAIDIYENLNLGGVSLNTFDLIIAKAAKINNTNFYDLFVSEMYTIPGERPDFIPELFTYLEWSSVKYAQSYSEKKSEVNSSFLNVFINLLAIQSKVIRNGAFSIATDDIKRETVLALTSEEIINNYQNAIRGLNRALCFCQFKLGIRKINDIKYEHVLLVLSYFLNNDDIWKSSSKQKKLEYWYWTSILAGCYDKDQTQQMVQDMQMLNNILIDGTDVIGSYSHLESRLFSDYYFTNKEILLMKQAHLNNLPKDVIKQTIMQFILSKQPTDFIGKPDDPNYKLKAWNIEDELEAHHILPLSTQTTATGQPTYLESTSFLRDDKEHFLNSPLNFTLILSSTNKIVGANSLQVYYQMLNNASLAQHIISPINDDARNNQEQWLETRFMYFKSTFMGYIQSLIA